MSVIRRRRPKYEFTQIPNAALRDYRLSWRARGLLAELLSYPPGYEISVDELVKRARRAAGATEGRDAMRTAVRELKQVGYIVSTRRQDARGRWITETEVTDDPAYELPGSPLPDGETTPVSPPAPTGVSAGRTDDGFSGVGEPGVGEPGSNKNTEINTEINTVLPPTPSPGGVPASTPTGKKEEEEEEKKKQQQGITALRGEARQLVEAALRLWHSDHQRPSAPTMRKLVDRVTAELAAGATPDAIIAVLTHNLHPSQARSAVRVVMARTKEAGWAVETTNPTELMQNTRPAWCGVCDETTRQRIRVLPDGRDEVVRCPECHPMAANPAPTPPPAAAEEETIYFVYHAGEDELTGGTGGEWDLPALPATEQGRDAATDTVPHTSDVHSAPPPAVIADLRAKLAEVRRQKAS